MFGETLVKSDRPKQTVGQIEKAKAVANSIRFNCNNRDDLDTKGYKGYLYHFKQLGRVQDKEYEELIVSAATMAEAIDTFKSKCLQGDMYENAEFNVTLMGVDFEPDRPNKIVMTY